MVDDEKQLSVIIPSYNRFYSLLNTILSIQQQTYKNIEIIVINDGSSQKEYHEYDWLSHGVIIIHLNINTKEKFKDACTTQSCIGFVRNTGIHIAQGFYIAFCDDDDIWFPSKIDSQIQTMEKTNCKMSSSDGFIGSGEFDKDMTYLRYNAEYFYNTILDIHRRKGSLLMEKGFPTIWSLEFLSTHNAIITSSVVIEKSILGLFRNVTDIAEDYDCWLRALQKTHCAYLNDVLFYYRTDDTS